MARPRTKGKRLQLGIDIGLGGWIEFVGRTHQQGQAGYLNRPAREDRTRQLQDPETERRYRMYLEAVGLDDELSMLDGGRADGDDGRL